MKLHYIHVGSSRSPFLGALAILSSFFWYCLDYFFFPFGTLLTETQIPKYPNHVLIVVLGIL
jgi:hypothetical protein